MEGWERRFLNTDRPTKKTKIRIHFLLVVLIIVVAFLFVLECYETMKSECYIDESKYKITRKINEPTKEIEIQNEFHLRVSYFSESVAEPTVSTNSNVYTGAYSITETRQDNNLTANDIRYRQMIRQLKLRNFCRDQAQSTAQKNGRARNLLYSDHQGVIYCFVPKVACTNWKRMMQVFDGKRDDPLAVGNKQEVHKLKYSYLNKLGKTEREWRKNLYYSFMFVRHPFERLLSAYRNKLLDPYSAAFQRRYGSKILKLFRSNLTQKQYRQGKNVTFKEFVDFLIYVYDNKGAKYFDEHWQVMHTLCKPCTLKYNYIGKMETLLQDANEVLKELGLYDKVKFPANATDKYKLEVKTLMKKYYSTLTKSSLDKLYEIYKDDFLSFGYEIPDYLQRG